MSATAFTRNPLASGTGADLVVDQALLDRIDEIVPPGTNVEACRRRMAEPAFQPAARRR